MKNVQECELSFSNSLLIKLQFYMYMYVQNVHLRTYLYYKIYRHYDLKNTCMHLLWHPLRQCEVLQRQYTQTKHFWVTEIRYQMNCDIIKFCKLSIALFSHGGLNGKIKKNQNEIEMLSDVFIIWTGQYKKMKINFYKVWYTFCILKHSYAC